MNPWNRALRALTPRNRQQPARHTEQRARAGNRLISWTSPGRPVLPDWDALYATRRLYYQNVYAYRCVQVRAQALAGLTPRVGPDPDKPGTFNPDAPLLQLLRNARESSWRALAAWSQAQLDITGRLAWELDLADDDSGLPVGLWALPAHRIDPVAAQRGDQQYYASYEYRAYDGDQSIIPLSKDEVFYVWRPKADDYSQPESVLEAQRLNIEVARSLDIYHRAFIENDARPAAAIVVKAFPEADDLEAFDEQWQGKYGGPRNAGRMHIVEAEETADGAFDATKALAVHTLGLNARDAQMLDMYQEAIRSVTVGFGVPLSMLGDSSNRTFANAEQEERNFWQGTMLPLVRDFEAHINQHLAPRLGDDRFWFDLSKVEALRPPPRVAVPGAREILGVAMTVNELRTQVLDLPRHEDELADALPGLALLGGPMVPTVGGPPALAAGEDPAAVGAQADLADRLDRIEQMLAAQQRSVTELPAPQLTAVPAPALPAPALPAPVPAPGPAPAPVVASVRAEPWPTCKACERVLADCTCETARTALPAEQRAMPPAPAPAPTLVPTAEEEEAARDLREEERRTALWTAADLRWRSLETLWTLALREHFDEQATSVDEKFTARARGRASRAAQVIRDMQQAHTSNPDLFLRNEPTVELRAFDISRLFDPQFWRERLARLARQLLGATWATTGAALAADLGGTFDLETPEVQDAIRERANQLSGQVTDTTYRRVQAALAEGVEAGEPVDLIAQRVQAVFVQASEQRALTIARTEVVSASNASTLATARMLGQDIAPGVQWIATRDHRTRSAHRDVDGTIVSTGEAFQVGNPAWPMRYPGDPTAPPHLTVNCRCALAPVTPEQMPRTNPSLDLPVSLDLDIALRLLRLAARGNVTPEQLPDILEVIAA